MSTKIIGVDIETSGLYPNSSYSWDKTNKLWVVRPPKIFCVAVNDGKSIEVHTGVKMLQLKNMLEDANILKIIHNAAFDCFWLQYLYKIKTRNIWDSRLMEQVIIGETLPREEKNEEIRKKLSSSLLYTLARYGLAELKNKELGASFSSRPLDKPLTEQEIEYAKNDVRHLLHLQALQEYRLRKLDLMRVANLENKTVERVVDMRCRGVLFDKNVWLSIASQNQTKFNDLQKRLPAQVSNWNSPAQVKKYFKSRGIPLSSFEELEALQKTYNDPVLNSFIEMRSYYKAVTTYGASWLEDSEKKYTVDTDNRIRTDFEQIVNTGRFSSAHPNLQNIPKNSLYRSALIAGKGKVFVIGDFSSQEIGIMAAASKEEIWIKAMLRKEDVHSLTASLLFPTEWRADREPSCTFPKKCKCKGHVKKREKAKIINFAIAYGAGPGNIGKQIGEDNINETIRLLNRYKSVVPALSRWLESNARDAVKNRITYSADTYKRRRTLRDPQNWMLENIGKNNPVQACGANMLKLSMISLSEQAPLVLTVHDEIILEVDKAEQKKAIKELKIIMEKAADYCTGVPGLVTVEPRIANNLLKE